MVEILSAAKVATPRGLNESIAMNYSQMFSLWEWVSVRDM
jgi:hypothetical protein